jgi:tetratricopeptide (TPR) repeat protein
MLYRFVVGVIAGFGLFAPVFEAVGIESPGPSFPTSFRDSKDARAYYNRAILYANKRQYELALRDNTTAIQLNPKYANAYHNCGSCYADIGEFDRAIADYSQAIRFDPGSASTFRNRGLAYEQLEQFEKAIADYDRVIRFAPKDADGYVDRGYAYFAKGNYRQSASFVARESRLVFSETDYFVKSSIRGIDTFARLRTDPSCYVERSRDISQHSSPTRRRITVIPQ